MRTARSSRTRRSSRLATLRRRYANLAKAPLWFLMALLAACWVVVWGSRVLAGASGLAIASAARHGASADAVFLASLYCAALFGFTHWYHRGILTKYTPALRKRLIP